MLSERMIQNEEPTEDQILKEMNALLKLGTLTDNPNIRKSVKDRLRKLSQIPIDNPYA